MDYNWTNIRNMLNEEEFKGRFETVTFYIFVSPAPVGLQSGSALVSEPDILQE